MSTQDPTKTLKRFNCFGYPYTRMCSENTGKTLARLDTDVSCKFAITLCGQIELQALVY